MDVDEALTHLGKFNRWQMCKYVLTCLSVTVSGCWHMMVIVFTGWEPDHHCHIPGVPEENISQYIPTEANYDGKEELSKCSRYVNISVDNSTMPCDNGWYYKPEFDSTIVTEWDLVCEDNYLSELSQSLFALGVCVGAVLFTTLADHIGRKPVHLGCQYAMIPIGLVIAFAPNYTTFIIMRFILGAVREGAGLTGIVMACELFPAQQRTFAGTTLELFWASSWMTLAGIAYFIRNWRHLQMAVTIPPVITLALIWLMPESIPWLAANGREADAEKILREAGRASGVHFPEVILKRQDDEKPSASVETNVEDDKEDQREDGCSTSLMNGKRTSVTEEPQPGLKGRLRNLLHRLGGSKQQKTRKSDRIEYGCLDIVRSRKLLLYAVVMCSLWFASGIVYYGLSLSTSTLAGDKYVNFFISGAVEAPAYMATIFVLQKWGRRWPLCIFHCVAGIVLFINIFIPEETESGINLIPLTITLTNIGKFSMTFAFGTVVLYAPEIYPTNLRNLGFGLASVVGRAATTLAPFSSYIAKIIPWVPGVVFATVSITTGLMVLLLPETLNRPLPDTIEEIESWTRSLPKELRHNVSKKQDVNIIRDEKASPSKGEAVV